MKINVRMRNLIFSLFILKYNAILTPNNISIQQQLQLEQVKPFWNH